MSDPLSTATERIRNASRRENPLAATFLVVEGMDEVTAKEVFAALLRQQFLDCASADLAQMLSQRLGVAVAWSHKPLGDFVGGNGEWAEGRGS